MKKIVYIAHQVSGDVKENVRSILKICHEIHKEDDNIIPFAPYLVTLQYLDDELIEERDLGIEANIEHIRRKNMDEVWLCGPKISGGMEHEIQESLKNNIPIKCYNPELKLRFEELVSKFKK